MYTNSFASRRATTTGRGFDAVLREVGVVGVRRARKQVGLGVIVRALVEVLHEEADRCTESDTMLNTRLQLNQVLLVALNEVISICLKEQRRCGVR